jgi:hypothetical protein
MLKTGKHFATILRDCSHVFQANALFVAIKPRFQGYNHVWAQLEIIVRHNARFFMIYDSQSMPAVVGIGSQLSQMFAHQAINGGGFHPWTERLNP